MACKIPEGSTYQHTTTYGTSGSGGLPTVVLKREIRIFDERKSPLGRAATLCSNLGRGLIQATGAGLGTLLAGYATILNMSPLRWSPEIEIPVFIVSIGVGATIGVRVATAAANLVLGKEKTN